MENGENHLKNQKGKYEYELVQKDAAFMAASFWIHFK
jgi:hypothetical protein